MKKFSSAWFFERNKTNPFCLRLVRMSAEFESNITSVERIKEYCETEHEVNSANLFNNEI